MVSVMMALAVMIVDSIYSDLLATKSALESILSMTGKKLVLHLNGEAMLKKMEG